jgi:phenylpyruvate tautomerase PptA (4-oxalocrotonate tautomerase family)
MPMMDLVLEEGALGREAKAWLVEELTALLLEFEGPPACGEPVRPVTWCFVDEVPADSTLVDRPPDGRPVYQIVVSMPGCADARGGPARAFRCEGLVQGVTELVLEAEGRPMTPSDALRVRVQVREDRDSSWGAFDPALGPATSGLDALHP